jgi:hypothetical protein
MSVNGTSKHRSKALFMQDAFRFPALQFFVAVLDGQEMTRHSHTHFPLPNTHSLTLTLLGKDEEQSN